MIMNHRHAAVGAVAALLCSAGVLAQRPAGPPSAPAGPQLLHPMFQDHAILQRDRPIATYGDTAPNTDVTVTIGNGTARARSDADGHWFATLPAMRAGGPYVLTAVANGETRTATDVLVGDVFLCSGQSNMQFAQRQADGAAEDARTATDGQIRQLSVASSASLTPRQTFAGGVRWVVGSPETVGGFSAACYYLARELKKTIECRRSASSMRLYGGARLRHLHEQ